MRWPVIFQQSCWSKALMCFVTSLALLSSVTLRAQFTELATELGVQHTYSSFGEGAGLSLVDFNDDGLDDLTLATGTGQLLALYAAGPGGLQAIYPEGIDALEGGVRSINWIDYDNDKDKDLFVTMVDVGTSEYIGSVRLLRQDPGFVFTDVTLESGIDLPSIVAYGSVWADYDNDGHLDLHISSYEVGGGQIRNYMFRSLGDGTFEEVGASLGLDDPNGISFMSVFFDADMDGNLDMFTANDRAESFNRFYRGQGDGTFVDESVESNLHTEFDAMGVDIGDYDNDGDLDVYVTNTNSPNFDPFVGNVLFNNDGQAQFTALTNYPAGTDIGTFWGCSFIDFDYDRDLDLFTVNHVSDDDYESKLFFTNDGAGNYVPYTGTEFTGDPHYASGVAQGDLNADGFLDLVVLNLLTESSEVWIGPQSNNGHIAVHLEGTISNRDGIGAIIEVWVDAQKRIDQTSTCNSFISQDSDVYRFGIGASELVDSVIIRWPSGLINKVYDIPAGTHLQLVESPIEEIDCIPSAQISPTNGLSLNQLFHLENAQNITPNTTQWSVDGVQINLGDELAYSFPDYGTYEVCASLASSCAEVELCEQVIISCPVPVAAFSASTQDLQLMAMDSSLFAEDLIWFLNGDEVGIGPSVTLDLPSPGAYELCQWVTNSCGTDTLCTMFDVSCTTPVPLITWESPSNLLLSASLSSIYDSVQWFVDGEHFNSSTLLYGFESAGEYELCASVWDQCGVDSTCINIEVICPTPIADFSWTQDSLSISITNNAEGDDFVWTLNGDILSLDMEEIFDLPGQGPYELCLEVLDTCGTAMNCDSIFADFASGIEAHTLAANQIEIWPIPSNEELFVKSSQPIHDIVLLDASGRLSTGVYDKKSLFEVRIPLASIQQGLYVIQISTSSAAVTRQVVVKR